MPHNKTRIAIDCMGGDHGICTTIAGVCQAAKEKPEVFFLLFGDKNSIVNELQKYDLATDRYSIHHKDMAISMQEKPANAVRKGVKESSMAGAIKAVADKQADITVSAGNTGALVALTKVILKTIHDIDRPIIASLWPTYEKDKDFNIMMDAGANIHASEKQMLDMCVLGEAFQKVIGCKNIPRVGILNIGAEDIKGHPTERNIHTLLMENDILDSYCGFMEPNKIYGDMCDVFITNGYIGNMIIKTAEGTASGLQSIVTNRIADNVLNKVTAMLALPFLLRVKNIFNPDLYNGGIIIGANGLVIKSHGHSTPKGFYYSILRATKFHDNKLMETIDMQMEKKKNIIHHILTKKKPSKTKA